MPRKFPLWTLLAGAVLATAIASPAFAWHVDGTVRCQETGLPVGGITVTVVATDGSGYTETGSTDEYGEFGLTLPAEPGCFRVSLELNGDTPVSPGSGYYDFCTTETDFAIVRDFVITGPSCVNSACWLTAGGAKFETIDKLYSGTNGPDDTWGGNVYPGCSATAGDGGNWNHVDHSHKLHFQGRSITVLRCGNVDGIPPGSTSPVTPYNYIEFTGTGTLKGIQGNKADYGTVYFWAHCEDRNEPGSKGVRDGAKKDRYFLNVYTNPADPVGSSVLLKDVDGNPATMDPITITDGNMQIHVTSCATTAAKEAPIAHALPTGTIEPIAAVKTAGQIWFANAAPTPARSTTRLSFGLPQEANVSLAAFDVSGRQVRSMLSGAMSPGEHGYDWNLRNDAGVPVDAGVYFVRLTIGRYSQTRPVVVVP